MKLKVIKPNSEDQVVPENSISIFLAGSIEMGVAVDWQTFVTCNLEKTMETSRAEVTILNPRRADWDSSWLQVQKNDQFNNQVNWELNHLEDSSLIFMYFDPNTKSPISLMELGLFADSHKMIVCCPDGFWRKGNVDVVCSRNNIQVFTNLEEAFGSLVTKIRQLTK